MIKTIFGKKLNIRDHLCSLNGQDPVQCPSPSLNLYVRINNVCQAKCKFCEFTGYPKSFDKHKLFYIVSILNKELHLNKVSFTGGEPTLNVEYLHSCLQDVKTINKDIFTVVNTNGYNLEDLLKNYQLIDSVALSRHHYLDTANNLIFNSATDAITAVGLTALANKYKNKIHLSCNLMKSYIGSVDEIIKYLEYASCLGIYDVGFVSLMQINDFCKNEFVDFETLIPELESKGVYMSKTWNRGTSCKCANFIYIPKNGKNVVQFYSRHSIKPNCSKSDSLQLVYDGEYLRDGFGGPQIY